MNYQLPRWGARSEEWMMFRTSGVLGFGAHRFTVWVTDRESVLPHE